MPVPLAWHYSAWKLCTIPLSLTPESCEIWNKWKQNLSRNQGQNTFGWCQVILRKNTFCITFCILVTCERIGCHRQLHLVDSSQHLHRKETEVSLKCSFIFSSAGYGGKHNHAHITSHTHLYLCTYFHWSSQRNVYAVSWARQYIFSASFLNFRLTYAHFWKILKCKEAKLITIHYSATKIKSSFFPNIFLVLNCTIFVLHSLYLIYCASVCFHNNRDIMISLFHGWIYCN